MALHQCTVYLHTYIGRKGKESAQEGHTMHRFHPIALTRASSSHAFLKSSQQSKVKAKENARCNKNMHDTLQASQANLTISSGVLAALIGLNKGV